MANQKFKTKVQADAGVQITTETASRVLQLDGSGNVSSSSVTNTELSNLSGVTSTVVSINGTQTLTNKTLTSPVINTPTGIVKGDVGLGNVDNTSDANKPVSTAQQTAINAKVADAINDGTTTIAPSQNAVFDALALKAPLADSSTYKVGPGRQYTTIQSALTAIGAATSTADAQSPKLVVIAGGIYDEDLTIPLGRILTLQAEGTVILGNGSGSNWSSTNTRNITADYNSADIFSSTARPALNIIALPGSDPTSTFLAHAGTFNISGSITITGAYTRTVNLSSVKLVGAFTDSSAGLTNLQAYRTLFGSTLTMSVGILERCYDCEFTGLVSVNSFNAIINSEIKAGMTVVANSNTLPPSGMFFTTFFGTFTGPASSAKLDVTSDYFFRTNGAALGGSATKVLLASNASSTVTGLLSSTDWSTFNSKQAAGNYITDLTGEVTASGPGSVSATVSNAAVIAKVLTGFSSGAGTVSATDSILTSIQKVDGNLTAHLNDTVDAHDASAISNVASGNLSSTDVQSALNELQGDIDTINTNFVENAQDAVGTILVDSASVDFTYNDGVPSITAAVLPAGVDHNSLQNFVANKHIDHSAVVLSGAANGGITSSIGDITASRSISIDVTNATAETSADNADLLLIYDNSATALRKMTRGNFLSGIATSSAGDLNEASFSLANNQSSAVNVTGFAFANGVVRSFKALVSVEIDATADVFETFELQGIQKGVSWEMAVGSVGDDSQVVFSITTAGQIQYTSANLGGFVSGLIKFRAIVTSF